MKKTRVLIVEEYEGIIQVFRRILKTAPEIEIIWEAKSELEAVLALEVFKPDVILMNSNAPWRQALKVWRQFKAQAPDCKLLAMTTPENSTQAKQAKALEIAFLAKEEMVRSLIPTLRGLINASNAEKCAQP